MPPIDTFEVVKQLIQEDYPDNSLHFPGEVDKKELKINIDGKLKEVASVGRLIWFDKNGEAKTFALRNIARKTVKRIQKEVNTPAEGIPSNINNVNFPLSETIEGPPSEKIKYQDYIRIIRLCKEGICPPNKKIPFLILATYLRGLTEEIPTILDYEIEIKGVAFKKQSFQRDDKVLILIDLVINRLDLPEGEAIGINDDVIVNVEENTVNLSWERSVREAQEVPKEFSGRVVTLEELNEAITQANNEPGNDKAEVLIQSWLMENPDLEWNITAEDAQMLLHDIYEFPYGVPEPKLDERKFEWENAN